MPLLYDLGSIEPRFKLIPAFQIGYLIGRMNGLYELFGRDWCYGDAYYMIEFVIKLEKIVL